MKRVSTTNSDHAQFTTFWVDGLYFGVEVAKVQEVLRFQQMTRVPLAPPVISGLINLRGQIVTAIDMRQRLALSPQPKGARPPSVIVRTDDGMVSLLVDEIGEVLEVSLSAREPLPETLHGVGRDLIRSVYKLDGKLLLVLDAERAVHVPIGNTSMSPSAPATVH